MANHRGTTYSKDHMSLFPTGFDYWNFSMHEIGVYDLAATILYINEVTGKVLFSYTLVLMNPLFHFVFVDLRNNRKNNTLTNLEIKETK